MLTVSGLRGVVGCSLTPPVAARFAAAFGRWLKRQTSLSPLVVLGRDSRPSGEVMESAAAAGLASTGCRVTRLGIATTPGVAIMTRHLGANGGLVITASHNPTEWNGIKTLRADGAAPTVDETKQIIDHFEAENSADGGVDAPCDLQRDDSTHRVHVALVLEQVNTVEIRARRFKVVLDSVNGAGGPATAMLLHQLGVDLVHLHAEPTGRFSHPPEPARANLGELCGAVKRHDADVGFAQDPDADRLAVVDETGLYIGEEYSLALCALHVLNRGEGSKVVVANLSTSRMIDDIAAEGGERVVRTPVGEAHVAAAMKAHGAAIGGEGNGGVILAAVGHVRDSLVGIALILQMLADRRRSISNIVATIPRYAIIKDKIASSTAFCGSEASARLAASMRRHFPDQKLDFQDGVRVDWPDRWVHVRQSNTEPIVRIFAEAGDEGNATDLVNEVRRALG